MKDLKFDHFKQVIINPYDSRVVGYEYFTKPIIDNRVLSFSDLKKQLEKEHVNLEMFERNVLHSILTTTPIKDNNLSKNFINVSAKSTLFGLEPVLIKQIPNIVLEIDNEIFLEMENNKSIKEKIELFRYFNIDLALDNHLPNKTSLDSIKEFSYLKFSETYLEQIIQKISRENFQNWLHKLKSNDINVIVTKVEKHNTLKLCSDFLLLTQGNAINKVSKINKY